MTSFNGSTGKYVVGGVVVSCICIAYMIHSSPGVQDVSAIQAGPGTQHHQQRPRLALQHLGNTSEPQVINHSSRGVQDTTLPQVMIHSSLVVQDSSGVQSGLGVQDEPNVNNGPSVQDGPSVQNGPSVQDDPAVHNGPSVQDDPAVHNGPNVQDGSDVQNGLDVKDDNQHISRLTLHPLNLSEPQVKTVNAKISNTKCSKRNFDSLKRFALDSKVNNQAKSETFVRRRFIKPPGPLTALASFPGAGNTWTRHLIEELSGKGHLYIHPSKRKRFVQNVYDVGPTSKMLGRRCTNAIQFFGVCWTGIILHKSL